MPAWPADVEPSHYTNNANPLGLNSGFEWMIHPAKDSAFDVFGHLEQQAATPFDGGITAIWATK